MEKLFPINQADVFWLSLKPRDNDFTIMYHKKASNHHIWEAKNINYIQLISERKNKAGITVFTGSLNGKNTSCNRA